MRFSFTLFFLLTGCTNTINKEVNSQEIDNEKVSNLCEAATYSVLLQVYAQSEEPTFTENPPLCETPFEIEFREDDTFESEGNCEFERAGETRSLELQISGQKQQDTEYSGEVVMIRRNGEAVSSSVEGSCQKQGEGVEIDFEWYLVFQTPHGEREHHGILHNSTD